MSFVLYEPVRNAIAGDVPRNEIPFYKRVLAGGTAGGISIIMVNPTDVIKTQMQAHKGDTAPRMRDIFSGVMRNAGVGGLWRGWQPNVARCFIGNACEIGCYDEVKTRIVGAVRHCSPKVPDTSVPCKGSHPPPPLVRRVCRTAPPLISSRAASPAPCPQSSRPRLTWSRRG